MKAEIFNLSMWIDIVESKTLKEKFDKLLISCDFTILNYMGHQFLPYGYTGIWLLAESHFALHTFPEEQKTYIELSSCNKKKYERFKRKINEK